MFGLDCDLCHSDKQVRDTNPCAYTDMFLLTKAPCTRPWRTNSPMMFFLALSGGFIMMSITDPDKRSTTWRHGELGYLPTANVLQFKPLNPSVRVPVFSRSQLCDCFLVAEVFRLDSGAKAHNKGRFHEPEARRHVDFLVGVDCDDSSPYSVDFSDFAASDGLKRFHHPSGQSRDNQLSPDRFGNEPYELG